MGVSQQYFNALFAGSDDPWAFKTRWYEERKRAMTLASLPAQRYRSAFEPGCANAELSAALADRCEQLLLWDGTDRAVEVARERVSGLSHVRVAQGWVPARWPEEAFDLIVISELGYFLDASALDGLCDRIASSLRPGGTVLACHWRHPIAIEHCSLTGDEVNERIGQRLRLSTISGVQDKDFRLDVWCADGRSVGQREGLC